MGVKEILEKYIKDLNENNKGYENDENPLVINKDWENYNKEKIDVIYVGDNPGEEEKKQNKYLVGPSGIKAQEFIKVNDKIYNYKHPIFFNKCTYFSASTKSLNKKDTSKIKDSKKKESQEKINKNHQYILENISLTVKCIYNLWNINKETKIYVFGIDKGTNIVKYFFEQIKDIEVEFLNNVICLNHPSNNQLFSSFGIEIFEKFKENQNIKINYKEFVQILNEKNKKKVNM